MHIDKWPGGNLPNVNWNIFKRWNNWRHFTFFFRNLCFEKFNNFYFYSSENYKATFISLKEKWVSKSISGNLEESKYLTFIKHFMYIPDTVLSILHRFVFKSTEDCFLREGRVLGKRSNKEVSLEKKKKWLGYPE